MKVSLAAILGLLESLFGGEDWNLRGSAEVGTEPHTDDTIKQAAVDWCTGGDARDAVIGKHGAMKDWDVSAVTNMANLFNGDGDRGGNDIFQTCVLYVEDWNTSSVTDMSWMFDHASAFNGDLSNFDTSSVTDMSWMFSGASAFEGKGLTNWMTYLVRDFRYMFSYTSFDADISQWDVSDATNFDRFLCNADSFNNNLCDDGSSPSWFSAGYCVDGAPPSDPCA